MDFDAGSTHRKRQEPAALAPALDLGWTRSAAARQLRGSEGVSRVFDIGTSRKSNHHSGVPISPIRAYRD